MDSNSMTLQSYAKTWMQTGPHGVHPRTAANYSRSFRLYVLPVLGPRPLIALDRHEIRALFVGLLARGKGTSVVRNAQIALASCLTAALDEGLVATNPARGTLRRLVRHRPLPGVERALSRVELTRFLAASRLVAPVMDDLFWTLAYSGCAISEGLGLQPDDVDGGSDRLRIARQWIESSADLPKGGRVRIIDIPHALTERLTARASALPGHHWLFQGRDGMPWHSSSVRNKMRAVLRAADLPARYSPHWLRHSYSCRLLEETGDLVYVQRQLGHRSISMTADLYGAAARPERRGAIERLVTGAHLGPVQARPPSVTCRVVPAA